MNWQYPRAQALDFTSQYICTHSFTLGACYLTQWFCSFLYQNVCFWHLDEKPSWFRFFIFYLDYIARGILEADMHTIIAICSKYSFTLICHIGRGSVLGQTCPTSPRTKDELPDLVTVNLLLTLQGVDQIEESFACLIHKITFQTYCFHCTL
jgi:hypothetical protein